MKSSYDPLDARPGDPLARYIAEAEQAERERAEWKRQQQREERREIRAATSNRRCDALEQRLTTLEAGYNELGTEFVEAMQCISQAIDAIVDQRVDVADKYIDKIHDLQVEVKKLNSAVTELREQRAKEFQFAREKWGEIEDLPNPLQARRDLN